MSASVTDGERALRVAATLADSGRADEVEVRVDDVRESFVRFAGDGPTQSADRDRTDVSVRVRLREGDGFREASASCTSLDESATHAALDRALELARFCEPNPELAPMGGPVEVPETGLVEATVAHDFAAKSEWVREAVSAARGRDLAPAGLVTTSGLVRTIVNSAGRAVQGATTRASFALTASGPTSAGWGGAIVSDVTGLEPSNVIERATEKALRSAEPVAVGPGEYTVVLEPAAVSSLLLFASYCGFGAQEVLEQSSFLCGREGATLFPETLTVVDDARNEVSPGLPFDGEGSPRERVELISRGVLGGPVTDRNTARKLGTRCTGHSLALPNTHGPMAENLVVAPGGSTPEELLAGVERGLLVTQFHYTNMIDPRDLTLTGMTRNGTFLVEHGEVVGGVKNLRFTQSLVSALANLTGVGRDPEVTGALFEGELVTPWLRIDGFRFTSTSDF